MSRHYPALKNFLNVMMDLEFVPNGKSEVMFEVINLNKL